MAALCQCIFQTDKITMSNRYCKLCCLTCKLRAPVGLDRAVGISEEGASGAFFEATW